MTHRGVDPEHHENRGLRLAMARHAPLVYFHGIVPGRYLATWPAYIVGDSPAELAFTVAIDDRTWPMLRHGLQGFQNTRIWTPRHADQKPRPEFLEERYAVFRKAS